MGEPAEASDDVAVVPGVGQRGSPSAFGEGDGPLLVGQIFRMRERQHEEHPPDPASTPADDPPECATSATTRARASVAYIRAVPRKELRGNWSSMSASASAPSAAADHSARPPRAAAS